MGKRILLVEGKDDEHVIKHLCKAFDIDKNIFEINSPKENKDAAIEEGGLEQLLDQIPIRLKESDLERLAVIVDADENIADRWQQLCYRFKNNIMGIPLPDVPPKTGTTIDLHTDFGPNKLGIWIMPNNELPGMLESFLAFLVPENDTMMPRVDSFLNSIPLEERRFRANHHPKARIHCYLAVQKEPGKPLGLSITARYLDVHSQIVQPFINWLKDVLID